MRFNFSKRQDVQRNHEGESSYRMSPQLELYTLVCTSSLSGTFYEKDETRIKRLRDLVKRVNPLFVAKLAVYARTQMNLRSIPLVLVVELAKVHQGDDLVKRTVIQVIQRADEITELLAYYQQANARSGTKKLGRLSKQLQKGVAEAFSKFDEYQLAKYDRAGAVTLKDALFLSHPKAKSSDQQVLFDKLVQGSLEVPYTWEVELSKLGQERYASSALKEHAFRDKWEELILSGKLGYMALLRNLRNILEAKVSESVIETVADRLGDPTQVRRSKQLPFRFLSAYRELQVAGYGLSGYLMEALENAIRVSAENIPGYGLDTKVMVAADTSGSMYQPVSPRSKILAADVGLVMGMLMRSRCKNVETGIWADTYKSIQLPGNNILANSDKLRSYSGQVGWCTNGHEVINYLIKRNQVMDKVMIFTDMQLWNSHGTGETLQKAWRKYKRLIAPQAQLYIYDLIGYGHAPVQFKANDVHLLAGWSEKVFEVLNNIDKGQTALTKIKSVEL